MSRRSLRNYVMFLAAVSGLGLLAQAPAQAQDARAGKAQGPATECALARTASRSCACALISSGSSSRR
jgi:hypothetical protein